MGYALCVTPTSIHRSQTADINQVPKGLASHSNVSSRESHHDLAVLAGVRYLAIYPLIDFRKANGRRKLVQTPGYVNDVQPKVTCGFAEDGIEPSQR